MAQRVLLATTCGMTTGHRGEWLPLAQCLVNAQVIPALLPQDLGMEDVIARLDEWC